MLAFRSVLRGSVKSRIDHAQALLESPQISYMPPHMLPELVNTWTTNIEA